MTTPLSKPPFVTIEGVDGAGKSSHLNTVVRLLKEAGFEVASTREPGGTDLSERLREEILNTPMNTQTTVLLAFASRSENLEKIICPALKKGQAVVCDRFTDSTYAYQGAGDGHPIQEIEALEKSVQKGLQPDLTLVFDLPVEESMRRLLGTNKIPDKFESQPPAYFERVRNAYIERANKSNGRMILVDSSVPIDEVSKQVVAVMTDFLKLRVAAPDLDSTSVFGSKPRKPS